MYIIGISITVMNVVINNLNAFIILVAVCIGVLWFFLGLYATRNWKSEIIVNAITSFAFSIGIIYGAILNTLIIPLYVYYFFLTASFLQLSREVIKGIKKGFKKGDKSKMLRTLENVNEKKKILKHALIFQMIAIVFFILPVFTNILYPTLFFLPLVFGLIAIGFASFFTLNVLLKNGNLKKIAALLKIGILMELIAFIISS